MKKSTFRFHRLWACVSLIGILVPTLSACSIFPQEEEPVGPPLVSPRPPAYVYNVVKRGNIMVYNSQTFICQTGSIQSIKMPMDGKLKGIYIGQSTYVEKGKLVAQADFGDMDLELKQMEQDINNLKAEYEAAKGTKDEIPKYIAWQRRERNYFVTKAQYDARFMKAEFSGVARYVNKDLKAGDSVGRDTLLVELVDLNSLRLVYTDPLETGDQAAVFHTNDKVDILVDGTKVVHGTVSKAPDLVDPFDKDQVSVTARRTVEVTFPKEAMSAFTIYMEYKVQRLVTSRKNVIVIPRAALKSMENRVFVQLINSNGVRVERDIKIGATDGTNVEVAQGLSEGERVLLS